ncbi:class I adenylate-forming enzyme family protein [Brevibacterium litoralis]|uniref:class I adenylate-forming enzyme family protein n=1 Tax=Brevibacterium litoralis TaxID=3138935 RepID=UPI0032EC40DF
MTHYFPSGIPTHLDFPARAVPEVLLTSARLWGARIAVADGDEVVTHTELLARARAVAADLAAHGIGPGSVVGLHMPNTHWYFPAYYGALFTGAAVTLVNPLQPAPKLLEQLADAGASAVVTHPAHLGPLEAIAHDLTPARVLVTPASWSGSATDEEVARAHALTGATPEDGAAEAAPGSRGQGASGAGNVWAMLDAVIDARTADGSAAAFEPVLQEPDAVAHYAYTGGTTGKSKGVRVLHRNVLGNVTQMVAWRLHRRVARDADGRLELVPIEEAGDPFIRAGETASVQVPPLFHAQGLTTSNMFLLGGITLVLAGRFRPETFVELVQRWDASYTSGNPPMFLSLADHHRKTGATMPSMRVAVSGAAPLDSTAMQRIAEVMPNAVVAEGYGLTEGTCMVTSSPFTRDALRKTGTVGIPVCDTEIEIRDADGYTVLPDDSEGELWVRGPQVTDGYANAPEQTAAQYVDGWLRTGDIASRDVDGFVRIHDRAKDMLIYKGYNVYPRELEDVAAGHPEVAQIAITGRVDGDAGEIPVAFVVPTGGAEGLAAFDAEAFSAWVAERVLPYQKIREVHVVDALPTSAAGKILKTELRAALG